MTLAAIEANVYTQPEKRPRIGWARLLTPFGVSLLSRLGVDASNLPTDENPITEALKQPDFVQRFGEIMSGFNRSALSRLSVLCQMSIYDVQKGPEGDGQPKGLRRQWYAWYKQEFAQPAAEQFGDLDESGQMNDLAWSQRMSVTYADIVDGGYVTYRDLWVEDASRMMEAIWEHLFRGCHIIVAVEKDSLFADFVGPAKSLGAASVYSGKGKSSKAGIEKVLRDHFGWPEYNSFSADRPLIVLHVSDHDFDGEAVIGPTFAEQARRYTRHILEARVGIIPTQIERENWPDKWYRVKVGNTGYVNWAEQKALFMAECPECGHRWPVQGVAARDVMQAIYVNAGHDCPLCDHTTLLMVKVGKDIQDQPYGFEVEAMTSRAYRRLLVQALLEVLPFDYIIEKLREECVASAEGAADEIAQEIYDANQRYQDLLKRYDEVLEIKEKFEDEVNQVLYNLGNPHIRDWEDEEDDPEPEDYEDHVDQGCYGPWRPFSTGLRTGKLIEFLKKEFADRIVEFEEKYIEF